MRANAPKDTIDSDAVIMQASTGTPETPSLEQDQVLAQFGHGSPVHKLLDLSQQQQHHCHSDSKTRDQSDDVRNRSEPKERVV
jgi:hypothetical protein